MKFTVVFKSINNKYLIKQHKEVGLEFIDKVRNELKENIPLENFPFKFPPILLKSFSIEISEELARKTKLYSHRNQVCVTVHCLNINQDIIEYAYTYNNSVVVISYQINSSKILAEWESNGFPLTWNPNKTQKEKDEFIRTYNKRTHYARIPVEHPLSARFFNIEYPPQHKSKDDSDSSKYPLGIFSCGLGQELNQTISADIDHTEEGNLTENTDNIKLTNVEGSDL